MREDGGHANISQWADIHPASRTRQLVSLQLSGSSDSVVGGGTRRRGVSIGAPCRICFQPGKDVMVPGFPGIQDYPDGKEIGAHRGQLPVCHRMAMLQPYATQSALEPRPLRPLVFSAGAVQTKTHGPGLYEPSRVVLHSCWKNRSAENHFFVRQTETVLASVHPWEVEAPVDGMAYERNASLCAVPEGKLGSYGHRSIVAMMLGCVPLITKESYSHNFFDEVINWSRLALHVPPRAMHRLPEIIRATDVEGLRHAATGMRRRLLWTSIYGSCHLRQRLDRPPEGGEADAFQTLMEVLAVPRRHFEVSDKHRMPRAPEMLDELYAWLRAHGGAECTRGYQCFDKRRVSCV
jgi:hypothetical protein